MVKLYYHQKKIVTKVIEFFKRTKKVLLCASCSSGKTVMSISLVKKWVRAKKRVAISTYSKLDLRDQWLREIKEKAPELLKHVQVVCKKADVDKLWTRGIPAVTNGNISKTKLITIFIPQSVSSNLGKFDYFVIDEAHEFLDVNRTTRGFKGGTLKAIINKHTTKKSWILGISATGFDLIRKGSYFEDSEKVIYDIPSALKDKVITDCDILSEYFTFHLKSTLYDNKGDLNAKGRAFIDAQFKRRFNAQKLKKVFGLVNGGKNLVIVPGGTDCKGVGQEKMICDFINKHFGRRVAVEKSSRQTKEEQTINENLFRESKNIRFMVVINMCGTGWDFPALDNVVDLTFTKNPKLIIHRLSRAIRKYRGKKIAKYIYCADQSKKETEVVYYICRALELTTKEGIEKYDGKIWATFCHNAIAKKGKKGIVSLKKISLSDYSAYADAVKHISKKNILRKNLSEIRSMKDFNLIDSTLSPFYLYWTNIRRNTEKLILELDHVRSKSKDSIDYTKKALSYLKRHHPKEFTVVYRN